MSYQGSDKYELRLKKVTIPKAGEDSEMLGHSYIACRVVQRHDSLGRSLVVSFTITYANTLLSINSLECCKKINEIHLFTQNLAHNYC